MTHKFYRIQVWCGEISKAIRPCVQNKFQEPACQGKLCEPMLNYLRDHANS
jgi:hypothetical protein